MFMQRIENNKRVTKIFLFIFPKQFFLMDKMQSEHITMNVYTFPFIELQQTVYSNMFCTFHKWNYTHAFELY